MFYQWNKLTYSIEFISDKYFERAQDGEKLIVGDSLKFNVYAVCLSFCVFWLHNNLTFDIKKEKRMQTSVYRCWYPWINKLTGYRLKPVDTKEQFPCRDQ